ncbi:MAG: hypothetical protein JO116_03160 [Planctomycetaceae bacterium]|nr:hypothetical protein [Planctomycetaceae bacterium]MBV8608096.1 hypothetical protein [Singulisphaera sp.]
MHPHRLLASRPALILAALLASGAVARGEGPCRLTVVERSVAQDQGSWQVDYRLRFEGEAGMVVTPAEVLARVEGWVSNSRVASHALPRWSSVAVSGPSDLTASGDVITSADESQRCRERVVLQVCACKELEGAPDAIAKAAVAAEPPPSLSLAPGATVRARLRLEHLHFLHGDYDPLLGLRTLELQLGAATLRDVIPTDCEQYLAQAKTHWPVPPEDRRDTRHYVSAPDSLHLEAHIPGNQYYRFPERPVRYSTKMRLRFWYLIAEGTEGQCLARVAQYRDTPTAWKVLAEGAHEECLTTVGRWVKVDRVLRTEPEATTLALDFRISNSDIGEMWIDDVTLEPVVAAPVGP